MGTNRISSSYTRMVEQISCYFSSIFYNNRIIYVSFITREDFASNSKRSIPFFHYSHSQYYFRWNIIQ